MSEKISYEKLLALLETKKSGDHDWFLSLLDDEKQRAYENEHISAVMRMLRIARIRPHKRAVLEAKEEIKRLAEHHTQYRNELTCYERSLLPVDVVLRKHTGFMDSPVYKRLEKDIREFLNRIK